MGFFSRLCDRLTGKDVERAFRQGFDFGIVIAEYFHEIPSEQKRERWRAMFTVLRQIANGEVTVVDTPEEFAAGKDYDEDQKRDLPQMLRRVRAMTKASAQRTLKAYAEVIPELLTD